MEEDLLKSVAVSSLDLLFKVSLEPLTRNGLTGKIKRTTNKARDSRVVRMYLKYNRILTLAFPSSCRKRKYVYDYNQNKSAVLIDLK